ncbi:dTDP-glucose 4,6-dehydratase [Haloactinopolyspora alba]|uniref:dTDP-glucose 4,6-dehydratase n=1 Tax=Haloactinopolyspora alba TaxID=648780 RepID=A0A2P8DWD0_9ACTN|nr:NAD-dependent epimerase/dehydratase family protein [Haloactinopolyspora alba]PSL01540.1 dTDP-glucose 4,6-dehydratase [Haloactinopolyspora alba]
MTHDPDRTRHAVVTGGGGFIGSHLCDALVRTGTRVTCIDSFETGQRGNLAPLLDDPRFDLVIGDVVDGMDIEGPADVVFHLAAPSTPGDYLLDPVRAMRTASAGTMNALRFAHDNRARFILVSTSEIYGPPSPHPQQELDLGVVDPVHSYDAYFEARRFGEALTSSYRAACNLRTGIARVFNTYGPRMRLDDGRVLSRFIRQVLANDRVTVPGSGAQRRSLCYVADTVTGLTTLAYGEHPGPVNIGNPDDTSVYELARQLTELSGSDTGMEFVDSPTDRMHSRRPDIGLATEVLGWRPRTTVREGLASTVAWFRRDGVPASDPYAAGRRG